MLLRNIEIEEQRVRQRGQIPFLVPAHYAVAQAYQRQLVKEMAEKERLERTPGYQEEVDRQLKDTKPAAVWDRSNPNRPVMVIGAGKMFREDLKELAKRTLEKPDPKTDPKWERRFDVINDLDRVDEAVKAYRTGRGSVYLIRNNPIARETKP